MDPDLVDGLKFAGPVHVPDARVDTEKVRLVARPGAQLFVKLKALRPPYGVTAPLGTLLHIGAWKWSKLWPTVFCHRDP